MPLHDWSSLAGWEGVHDYWIVELARDIKAKLPAPYRAYIGSTPALLVGAGDDRPDVAVRRREAGEPPAGEGDGDAMEPDSEAAALLTTDPQTAVLVTLRGRPVAAVELVSPRNKDHPLVARAIPLALPRLSSPGGEPPARGRASAAADVLVRRQPGRRG